MKTLKKFIIIFFLSTAYSKLQYNEFLVGTNCITKANETGVCEYYKNCQHLMEKVKSRQVRPEEIIKCNSQGIICCTPDDLATTTLDPTRMIKIGSLFQPRGIEIGRISEAKCKEYSKYTRLITHIAGTRSNPKPIEIVNNNCKHNSVQLIVGGTEAHKYEFPHQAHIGYEKDNNVEWACGGSLVSSNYVLTAAHCNGNRAFGRIKFVKLGMIDRSQKDSDVFIYNVEKVIEHDEYSPITHNNDIALLKLERNVNFTEFIYPICLPIRQHDEPKVIVTGLGKTGRNHAQSDILLRVVLEKFSHQECQEIFRPKNITENMLCYGNRKEERDSCRGDSGGPIQIPNDEESHCTYKLIGIVGFGYTNCGMPGVPGVYVNVYNYLAWIEGIVWKDE